jgi:23S rRNA (cytidine2498-2'-O)-methyltransferase
VAIVIVFGVVATMHLLLCAEDSEVELRPELAQSFADAPAQTTHPLLVETDFDIVPGQPLPHLAFARQWLPNARSVRAESIRAWAAIVFDAVAGLLPDDRPWSLHIEPHYGARATHRMGARAWHSASRHGAALGQRSSVTESPIPDAAAGRHRCRLIREALVELLQKKRRSLLRQLRRGPVHATVGDSLVQLLLTTPDAGFLSVAEAPVPFEQRHLLSPFPRGELPMASDKAAPSRAFAKLVEAELRLGRAIAAGETCVDLGASPGSWTYVAAGRGARVVAVDRSPLREDLMRSGLVEFQPGDAFRFQPPRTVDWLLCDVIAAPERTADLLLEWLRRCWCRHFVVTVKLKGASVAHVLAQLKAELPPLTCELFLTRLCANKKEICAFGSAASLERMKADG